MHFLKKEHKSFGKSDYGFFVLGGDIGGTNSTLGVLGIKNNLPSLLLSFHFKSRELSGLHRAVNIASDYTRKKYKIRITKACFAIAGVISQKKDHAGITNAKWGVSKRELLEKTSLKKIMLINDFEAVGYGISVLGKNDISVIKKGKKYMHAAILVIGAGTGLGKAVLVYNEKSNMYVPLPSEAGHSDFPAQSRQEMELVDFIKKYKKTGQVSYEQVLSGQGLENIYAFLRKSNKFKDTKYTKEIDRAENKPELMSKYRKIDGACIAAFNIFKEAYARCAKNFALDSLAFGGVYIAGGIAPKNMDIFDSAFTRAFENNYKLTHILKKIPVYLVLNQNTGLLGAGFFGAMFL